MTSIADLAPGPSRAFPGLAPGRCRGCVQRWLSQQSNAFSDSVQSCRSSVRRRTRTASAGRSRRPRSCSVTGTSCGCQSGPHRRPPTRAARAARPPRRQDRPTWAHRRSLLRAGDTLSPAALGRLKTVLSTDDPTGQIGAPWAVKELLRQLLQPTALPATPGTGAPPPHPLPGRLRGRGHARDDPANQDDRGVVAPDQGPPRSRRHQRPHQGLQPRDQAGGAGRLRVPQPEQRRARHRASRAARRPT